MYFSHQSQAIKRVLLSQIKHHAIEFGQHDGRCFTQSQARWLGEPIALTG